MQKEVLTKRVTQAALALLLLAFCISLFARLGNPLLWNDEGMTVMHSQRVLTYGYPKAWDGKNMVYDLMHPNKQLGLDPKTGAFIGGSGWGHYYFLAPFLPLTDGVEDLHTRTALLRLVFALAGLLGLLLLARLLWRSMRELPEGRGALLLFGILILLSIPLVLHLREVRYYSLLVLLTASLAGLVVRHRILKPMHLLTYNVLVWLQLGLLLITFSPAFFVFVFAIGLWELLQMSKGILRAKEGKVLIAWKELPPVLGKTLRHNISLPLSLLYLIPFVLFFRTFELNRELLAFNVQVQPYAHFMANLKTTLAFMVTFEPGWFWLGLKVASLLLLRRLRSDGLHSKAFSVSLFLSLLIVGYLLLCSRVPNFPFTRYFLPAIPLMAASIALDTVLVWRTLGQQWARRPIALRAVMCLAALALSAPSLVRSLPLLRGHAQELVTPYQGHLDLMIPWIREHYADTDKLVVAANYEETSFMYYLDAKVIVGYVQNNAPLEVGLQPDIIYFNSLWMWGVNAQQLEQYRRGAEYEEVRFPVRLYRVNNVPEVNYQEEITHQFRTLQPRWEGDEAILLVRKR